MSVTKFQELFKRSRLESVMALVAGLGRLGDEGKNVAQYLDFMGMEGIRIQDVLLRTAGSTDTLRMRLQRSNEYWIQGIALTEEANRKFATTKSRLTILKNAFIDTARVWGFELLPVINKTTEDMKPFMEQLSKVDSETKKAAMGAAAITAVLAPLLIGIAAVVSFFGAPFAALLALIPLVSFLIIKHWTKIKDFVWDTVELILFAVQQVLEGFEAMGKLLPKWARGKGDDQTLGWLKGTLSDIRELRDEVQNRDFINALKGEVANRGFLYSITPSLGAKVPVPGGGGVAGAPALMGGPQKSEVLIKLMADAGTEAKVMKVLGDANITVLNPAYVGAH
jgi:hypothetical protein